MAKDLILRLQGNELVDARGRGDLLYAEERLAALAGRRGGLRRGGLRRSRLYGRSSGEGERPRRMVRGRRCAACASSAAHDDEAQGCKSANSSGPRRTTSVERCKSANGTASHLPHTPSMGTLRSDRRLMARVPCVRLGR